METKHVLKYSGERVPFELEKLKTSLRTAGAAEETVEAIAFSISNELFEGITTQQIYQKAHKLLRKKEHHRIAKYRLKKAILELGPTGYPFEQFVALLMQKEGYKTEVGLSLNGKCVSHEVDVLAENEQTVRVMECKFHNRAGYKTDVKVPMYIKSRFEDLRDKWIDEQTYAGKQLEGWVVTNSRFTEDAIRFGKCANLHLFSWDYPQSMNLKELTNRHQLYPITVLSGLSKSQKTTLIKEGVVALDTLCEQPEALEKLDLTMQKMDRILEEIEIVCQL